MINTILTGIFKIITSLISLLLTPINNAITQYMPNLNDALVGFSDLLNVGSEYVGWFFDAMCISSTTINLLISVMVFKLTFPLIVSAIKLIVNWYEKLKL